MSNTLLVECFSNEPMVRVIGNKAVQVLNDRSLTRDQRRAQIRVLQGRLREHLVHKKAQARQQEKQRIQRLVFLSKALNASATMPSLALDKVTAPVQPLQASANEEWLPRRKWPLLTLKQA
jgi:hypothetical protein